MRKFFILIGILLCVNCFAQSKISSTLLGNSHDITTLSSWGPYSKQYVGLSDIDDISSGLRVDFTVIPGIYRRSYMVPNVLFEAGYYPWKVDPAMRHITYRYELEWKDALYVDVTYHIIDSTRVLLEMACHNNSAVEQNIHLQPAVSLQTDDICPNVKVNVPQEVTAIAARDYKSYEPAVRAFNHNLVYDGKMRGEVVDNSALAGTAIEGFGKNKGDAFEIACVRGQQMAFRYRLAEGERAYLQYSGATSGLDALDGTGKWEFHLIGLGSEMRGDVLRIESVSSSVKGLCFDTFFCGGAEELQGLSVEPVVHNYKPHLTKGERQFVVKYDAVGAYYGMAWDYEYSDIRCFENSELDVFMRKIVHKHVGKNFVGDRKGHYTAAFLRPVVLAPKSDTTLYCLIAKGRSEAEVAARLRDPSLRCTSLLDDGLRHWEPVEESREGGKYLPGSEKYAFGAQILQANILTDVVYPVYTQKEYIRHFTPGKNWNSLYTWDAGFISMALADIDPVKSFETLRAYTTEPGAQSAFIHHGTPLPIQFFAYARLANSLQSREVDEFMYPRLKQYFAYMARPGSGSSTLLPSGLIRTWDYFYSTGGWDDYPPQHQLRTDTYLYPTTAPMVSTSYYLRAAKILRMMASRLGLAKEVAALDKDIKRLTKAIIDNAWDEEVGYFSYVLHSEDGRPTGFYRYTDGTNYNMGLDGVTPLVAGVCSPEQKERLMEHIFSPEHLWSPVGISTVDMSAPYYKIDGYWNGGVWFPHQMTLWLTMLDLGECEAAHKIAFKALDVWEKECRESYLSMEHFAIESGRGCGWHHFSGLSCPVVNWYESYFRLGKATTGFETAILSSSFSEDYSSYEASLNFYCKSSKPSVMVLCLNPAYSYKATLGGRPVEVYSPYPGLLYITLPRTALNAKLKVEKL